MIQTSDQNPTWTRASLSPVLLARSSLQHVSWSKKTLSYPWNCSHQGIFSFVPLNIVTLSTIFCFWMEFSWSLLLKTKRCSWVTLTFKRIARALPEQMAWLTIIWSTTNTWQKHRDSVFSQKSFQGHQAGCYWTLFCSYESSSCNHPHSQNL